MSPREDSAYDILVEVHRRLEDLRKEQHTQALSMQSDIKTNTEHLRAVGARVDETRAIVDSLQGPVEDWKRTSEAANQIAKAVRGLAFIITTIASVVASIAAIWFAAKASGIQIIQYLRTLFP